MESVHKKYQDTSKNLSSFRTEKLSLERNSQFCELTDLDGYCRDFSDQHLLVELFSGAGGLSLGLEKAGFRNPVFPDCELNLEIEAVRSHSRVWKYKGVAKVNGKVMADAQWSATIVDRNK